MVFVRDISKMSQAISRWIVSGVHRQVNVITHLETRGYDLNLIQMLHLWNRLAWLLPGRNRGCLFLFDLRSILTSGASSRCSAWKSLKICSSKSSASLNLYQQIRIANNWGHLRDLVGNREYGGITNTCGLYHIAPGNFNSRSFCFYLNRT